MFSDEKIDEIVELLCTLDDKTKIYLGCDSVRKVNNKGEKVARYATVCIVHKNSNAGCRVFSHVSFEPDYDQKPNRPSIRMMNEVQKVSQLYTQIGPLIDGFDVEIHLDISTDPKNGSNCAYNSARGYIIGTTGLEPKFKPDAWAASHGSDHIANGKLN